MYQFSCSVVSDSSRPHELQHAMPPCLSPTPGVHTHTQKGYFPFTGITNYCLCSLYSTIHP